MFDGIVSYPYGRNAENVCKIELIKYEKLLTLRMLQENTITHNLNCGTIGSSGSVKMNVLFNPVRDQPDIEIKSTYMLRYI